ncbi:hypothetical protein HETIRDRAFT_412737 [Heterobasidion irregulare TC 32-1]|uniref:Uncharacterized protein n=1 Tax=Heterobasidion irregulare (strain TC 32-1) TaxID=747525 RepID=W4JMW3_HETIT|nr:uncharacterized protein HETIRDRAFT_412737 [Heterobasidion irregulare TC 32-1]ETW74799.1 hypothetical protein HETIRDRAFT_412737 [Heterobasidion irregulare TC 32-1]
MSACSPACLPACLPVPSLPTPQISQSFPPSFLVQLGPSAPVPGPQFHDPTSLPRPRPCCDVIT